LSAPASCAITALAINDMTATAPTIAFVVFVFIVLLLLFLVVILQALFSSLHHLS
jgi:hypothetical protein